MSPKSNFTKIRPVGAALVHADGNDEAKAGDTLASRHVSSPHEMCAATEI